MSYPNVSNYIHTNKVNIEELKLDIIESAKTAISDERVQVVENLTQNITRAMGDFWFSVDGTIPAGGLPHLGHLVSRALYQDFYIWLEGNKILLTDAEWLAYAEANGGCCPYYSSGDGSTTFRTPSYPDTFLKVVNDMNGASVYQREGLPNITGQWTTSWNVPARGFHGLSTSGCFYDSYPSYYNGTGRIWGSDENNSGTRGFPWFDASRSNAIYGASSHVTPKNVSILIGVYAIGAIVPVGATDAEKIMNEVVRIDYLMNTTPHIVDTYTSGNSWYRIYSDGWIEQGGAFSCSTSINATTTQVTFLKSFTNSVMILGGFAKSANNATYGQLLFQNGNTSLTGTVCSIVSYTNEGQVAHANSGGVGYWYACGY